MKALYREGAELYVTHAIPGTQIVTGDTVRIIETYSERGAETRYLVKTYGGAKAYVYESDLSTRDPLQENPRRRSALGAPVTLNLRPAQRGVFKVTKVLPGGRLHVRRSDGLVINVPASAVRPAGNPWPVELHSVTYRERKRGDGRPELYEHEFEGRKPRLSVRGGNLNIRRAGSRYRVRDGWIHG